ncbi:MAG: DUF1800 domain-containing protein [Candidatus Rokubacteria bacterium]|nr:DUF1800 domain-containing protein [Candidatus Rokubacteria bacterium]
MSRRGGALIALVALEVALAVVAGGRATWADYGDDPPRRAPAPRAPVVRPRPSAPAPLALPVPVDDGVILHVLSRAAFGPRPGDLERVRAMGLGAWLALQLDPARIDAAAVDGTLAPLASLRMSVDELLRAYPRPDPLTRQKIAAGELTPREAMEKYPVERRPGRIVADLQAAKMIRAVASERQLEEVMIDFWFNHFNVYALKGDGRWYVTAYERDAIRPHALGRFRDLLGATARHPAMLYYLDNWLSVRTDFVPQRGPNAGRRLGLNENYARELMELHTLGVDGGYTQADIREVARAFTGWSIDRPRADGYFIFRPMVHDPFQKTVLGARIVAGSGEEEGERVLDLLARHPSTARFIATKLCRRFVADDPPPALVERVASAFRASDGDARATLRALLTAPEFYGAAARRAKIKRPFDFVVTSARALGAQVDARGGLALARASAGIGEALYEAEPPTGYTDRAEQWVNPGALLARMNFALALAHNRIDGVRVDVRGLVAGADRAHPDAVLDRLVAGVLHGAASPATRAVLAAHLRDPQITRRTPDDRDPADTDVEKLAALVLGSPEFQRR